MKRLLLNLQTRKYMCNEDKDYFDGIVFSDGNTPLVEEWINPVFGYQAIHIRTGRTMPTCQRFEIFTWNAMLERIEGIAKTYPQIDTREYFIEPIYQTEADEMVGFVMKMSKRDFFENL